MMTEEGNGDGKPAAERAEETAGQHFRRERAMSKSGETLYETLGLTKQATADDIKKAYRSLALKYHPDRNYGNTEDVAEKFKEINHANAVLSNPTKRKIYDLYGSMGMQMAETLGDDNMEALLFFSNKWVKGLFCCCGLLTGCYFCCCCFCCCFNFCCGKCKPKHEDFDEYAGPEDWSEAPSGQANADSTPIIITEQPSNASGDNAAFSQNGKHDTRRHGGNDDDDDVPQRPTVIAMPPPPSSATAQNNAPSSPSPPPFEGSEKTKLVEVENRSRSNSNSQKEYGSVHTTPIKHVQSDY